MRQRLTNTSGTVSHNPRLAWSTWRSQLGGRMGRRKRLGKGNSFNQLARSSSLRSNTFDREDPSSLAGTPLREWLTSGCSCDARASVFKISTFFLSSSKTGHPNISRSEVAESGGTDKAITERVGRTVLTNQHQRRNLEASKTSSPKLRLAADGEDVRRGIVCT